MKRQLQALGELQLVLVHIAKKIFLDPNHTSCAIDLILVQPHLKLINQSMHEIFQY